jgi:putative protease
MTGTRLGEVSHYYDRISVAVITLTDSVKVGEKVHFLGHGVDFEQEVSSMQIEHEAIESAKKGDQVAMKVLKPVKPHTAVFKISE